MNEQTNVYLVDTETTGIGSNDQVIELAWIDASMDLPNCLRHYMQLITSYTQEEIIAQSAMLAKEALVFSALFTPTVEINEHAFAVHGISRGKLALEATDSSENVLNYLPPMKYMVAHNANFDYRMLGKPDVKCICTLAIAKKLRSLGLLTIGENNKLEHLIDMLYPEPVLEKQQWHRALDDCFKLVLFLNKVVEMVPTLDTWDKLYAFSGGK